MKLFSALLALGLFVFSINAAELDPTFGTNGKVTIDVGLPAQIDEIEVLDDGSILAAGHTFSTTSTYGELFLVRLTANGERMTSFGINGVSFLTTFEEVQSVDFVGVKDNGKFVAAGTFLENGEQKSFLSQFLPDGSRDIGFNGSGLLSDLDIRQSVTKIVGDGIVFAGRAGNSVTRDITPVAVRIDDHGNIDSSFGSKGVFSPQLEPMIGDFRGSRFSDIELGPSGALFFAIFQVSTVGDADLNIRRHVFLKTNQNGQLDGSWGESGFVYRPRSNGSTRPSDIAVTSESGIWFTDCLPTSVIRETCRGISRTIPNGNLINGTLSSLEILGINGLEYDALAVELEEELVLLNDRYRTVRRYLKGPDETTWSFRGYNSIISGGGNSNSFVGFARYRLDPFYSRPHLDFDLDGKSDIGIWKPDAFSNTGRTDMILSASQEVARTAGDFPAFVEDFTTRGQGLFDLDRRPVDDFSFGRFSNHQSSTSIGFYVQRPLTATSSFWSWGIPNDIPAIGDFNGDGIVDLSVFRNGEWWIRGSQTIGARNVQWGLPGDIPVVADYDGDFIDDIAIFRPSNSQWWVRRSSDGGTYALQFGLPGDKPVPADYDGDGAEDVAVYRPSEGVWYLWQSTEGFAAIRFGLPDDDLVPADYDGDGKVDIAVFREGVWYILQSQDGLRIVNWGEAGDRPLTNQYAARLIGEQQSLKQ